MKKSVMLMVGILAVALAGSAQATTTMFAVQNSTPADVFAVADDGQVTANGLTFKPATKKFGFGTTNPLSTLHVVDTAASFDRGLTIQQAVPGAAAAVINIKKSSGTEASPGFPAPVTGSNVAAIHGQVWDGNVNANTGGYVATASIFWATEPAASYTLNNIPTYIALATGNGDASASLPKTERFRITSDGRMRLYNQPAAPANNATCTQGDMILDAANANLYLCASTNSWRKLTFATY